MTRTSDRLAEIVARRRAEAAELLPKLESLKREALRRDDFRGFRRRLFQPGRTTLVAEVKKASPSAGVIAADFDPVAQAVRYAEGGAEALSVLTEKHYFQGDLSYLAEIRAAVGLPLLRKDFIVEAAQIYESVAAGADAVLLIAAALGDAELREFYDRARDAQLDVLVEVHDLREMDRVLELGADIIGINNRNLRTFEVDLKTTEQLAPEIPSDCLGICESGIRTRADVEYIRGQGIDCFLVGETLMRAPDVGNAIRELFGER
jgi:indole-3-glycerol phosphate synthase